MDGAVDHYGTLAAVGLDHVVLSMSDDTDDTDDTAYELVGELVRQLGTVGSGTW